MQDVPITNVLASLGLKGSPAESKGLAALYAAGLTRPGKSRIAKMRVGGALDALRAALVRVCHKQACDGKAQSDGRTVVKVAVEYCDGCGGTDNGVAVSEMLAAMRRTGRAKLLVVGGAPNSRSELEELCGSQCELRLLTAENKPGRKTSDAHVAWADVVAIRASTQVPHKMTMAIRGPHVITCGQRGVAALARDIAQHLTSAAPKVCPRPDAESCA